MAYKSTWFFSSRFVTFLAGQTGFSDGFVLTLMVGVRTVRMTWMSFDCGLVYHLPGPASVWSPHTGAVIRRGGADPSGIWDERNVSWTPQEPSCHNTKDTNTPCQDGQRDVNTEGRGGRGERCCVFGYLKLVTRAVNKKMLWHAAWICNIFRESVLSTQNRTGLGCLLTITMTTFALRSSSQKTTTEGFQLIY